MMSTGGWGPGKGAVRAPLPRIGLFLFVAVLCAVPVWPFGGGDAGTSAAPFLKIGPGARPAALGEAFSAVEGDVHGVYYNPAGLAGVQGWQLAGMHDRYVDGLSYNFLAAAVPARRLLRFTDDAEAGAPRELTRADLAEANVGASSETLRSLPARPPEAGVLGLAVYSLSADDIERRGRTDTDAPDGTFGSDDVAVALAYAQPLGPRWRAGGSVKFIRQSLDDRSAAAFAVDGGALYRRDPRWTFSGGLRHLGSKPNLGGTAAPLPLTLYLGTAHRPRPDLLLSAELGLPRDDDPSFGLGVEYSRTFQDSLRGAARLGYLTRNGQADGTGLAFGFGAGRGAFDFDFAWVPVGQLGHTFRFSVKLGF